MKQKRPDILKCKGKKSKGLHWFYFNGSNVKCHFCNITLTLREYTKLCGKGDLI